MTIGEESKCAVCWVASSLLPLNCLLQVLLVVMLQHCSVLLFLFGWAGNSHLHLWGIQWATHKAHSKKCQETGNLLSLWIYLQKVRASVCMLSSHYGSPLLLVFLMRLGPHPLRGRNHSFLLASLFCFMVQAKQYQLMMIWHAMDAHWTQAASGGLFHVVVSAADSAG